jgi:flagellar capping protein FliD
VPPDAAANLASVASNDEILAALIDFRDFVAEKFERTDARLGSLDTRLDSLQSEMRTGFDRVDRRFERLESRIEDLETRTKT